MPNELDNQLQEIARQVASLKRNKKYPEERKPKIIVCGGTGGGKTTSINTLFGKKVGQVGHFSFGTEKDEVFVWESNSDHIRIVDLPGLGQNQEKDKEFVEMYKKHIKDSDGFIVIVAPPRPAEDATIQTLKLLLSCGVPNKNIILGYNKLSHLNYDKNGKDLQVELDGLRGPVQHLEAVKEAKKVFFEDLKREFRHDTFQAEQIIEFDSKSGWNLHAILKKIVDNLPSDTLLMVSRSAEQAFDEAKKREQEKLDEERKSIIQQKKALQILQERIIKQDVILKKQGEVSKPDIIKAEPSKLESSKPDVNKLELDKVEKKRQNLIERKKQQEKELEQQKKNADEREKAIGEFDKKSQDTRSIIVKTFLGGLGIFLTKLLEEGAKKILELLVKK